MSYVKIKPSKLSGKLKLPISKSIAHRALICSFLAGNMIDIDGEISDDIKATILALNSIKNNEKVIDCNESGSTLRFLIPICAVLGKNVVFTGKGRLPKRPLGEYLRLLPEHNVNCKSTGGLPLSISGELKGGIYEIEGNISSQYITGLLLALPLLKEDSEIVLLSKLQSSPYVDMTIDVMRTFGVNIDKTKNGYHISGNQTYKNVKYEVESDWSQAAFFLVPGVIDGDIELQGLNIDSTQGDKEILNVLNNFGGQVKLGDTIKCKKSNLVGTRIDASNIPDAIPALSIVAALSSGTTEIYNAERLRLKESDRIRAICDNLKRMGARFEEKEDGIIIHHSSLHGANLDGYNDHRIVMAFSIAALFADGETIISDAESINKSYPTFFEDYNRLGGKADVISNM